MIIDSIVKDIKSSHLSRDELPVLFLTFIFLIIFAILNLRHWRGLDFLNNWAAGIVEKILSKFQKK
ncbi:MAG: hypothetical protein A2174_00145 [Candidatus Portnoybacteria bacterium RBG_13_41_18]|uniref:Uncharacterized protein n=1 Tax=Candidatus Portnoybacteria bacterium RBG_13_41_18 TaxID=1801991 RepID=A0A1G2F4J7_9BACT|nr:MAG: hypothetical protein A2174_00145 [Candidatus Portnoybacteria bacterium RBG_13_41_18]